ncbi:chlorite dismutase family protein [Phycisphaerales bacterium AB-hyl4]|uniref:Chlorite dismutase family protein n=1 Tax=Natronomicrosphaera hydrolytica TaxID=3242702 RepID=A0ABV4U7Q5_9BACT
MEREAIEKPDLSEKGRAGQTLDRRLFVQLLAFTGSGPTDPLIGALQSRDDITATLYEDATDPRGVALLTLSEDPAFFVGPLRDMLNVGPWAALTPRPELTMFGRTYSLGYEPDLEETLINRPRNTALNPDWPWAIWYPLRRSGQFMQLPEDEQREILMEHGKIGFAFGRADYAHDIRLACHGLDRHDNDFVVGIIGKELHPLSAVVQAMRGTTQTSLYLEHLGPFFIGRAAYQTAP